MWRLVADAATQSGDGLLAAVIGISGVVVTGVVTVIVALINRAGKAIPAPEPDPDPEPVDITIRERVSILEYRADATDRSGEIVDRRLDQIERALDLDNPRWRSGHR